MKLEYNEKLDEVTIVTDTRYTCMTSEQFEKHCLDPSFLTDDNARGEFRDHVLLTIKRPIKNREPLAVEIPDIQQPIKTAGMLEKVIKFVA